MEEAGSAVTRNIESKCTEGRAVYKMACAKRCFYSQVYSRNVGGDVVDELAVRDRCTRFPAQRECPSIQGGDQSSSSQNSDRHGSVRGPSRNAGRQSSRVLKKCLRSESSSKALCRIISHTYCVKNQWRHNEAPICIKKSKNAQPCVISLPT